jgi:hypothetical protein
MRDGLRARLFLLGIVKDKLFAVLVDVIMIEKGYLPLSTATSKEITSYFLYYVDLIVSWWLCVFVFVFVV